MTAPILCVGELLWDAMPDGLFLGGAPYNVACHLHQLGVPVTLVSRVGDDALGREAVRRVEARGLHAGLVQTDPDLPTGLVRVEVDADGMPSYEIEAPAAWDALDADAAALEAARGASALVFGSLAQRREPSRAAVRALLRALAPDALAVFDVNLRPPFDDRALVDASLEAADVVKLNEEERITLADWFGLGSDEERSVATLAERFGCRAVCVTRGGEGAALWHAGRWTRHAGYPVEVRDTVGAGDAFLAGLLSALVVGVSDDRALARACRLGAFVAGQPGATPEHPPASTSHRPPRTAGDPGPLFTHR